MIKFMRYYWLYFVISGLVLIPGIFSLINWGLQPSNDFTGGTLLELQIDKPDFNTDILRSLADDTQINISSIQETDDNTYLLKADSISQQTNSNLQAKIATYSAEASLTAQLVTEASDSAEASISATVIEKRFETLGPSFGRSSLIKAITAIGVVAIVILSYVSLQFKNKKYGACAVLAMFHDSFILLGVFSLLGHFYGVEVDTLFMTAVLTILSSSVHDTMVIYNRVRESQREYPSQPYASIIDKAMNETIARNVNNSMTIIFMLLSLFLLGGETIRWFVFALLVGSISGTYSSTFIAAPLLIVWDKIFDKK